MKSGIWRRWEHIAALAALIGVGGLAGWALGPSLWQKAARIVTSPATKEDGFLKARMEPRRERRELSVSALLENLKIPEVALPENSELHVVGSEDPDETTGFLYEEQRKDGACLVVSVDKKGTFRNEYKGIDGVNLIVQSGLEGEAFVRLEKRVSAEETVGVQQILNLEDKTVVGFYFLKSPAMNGEVRFPVEPILSVSRVQELIERARENFHAVAELAEKKIEQERLGSIPSVPPSVPSLSGKTFSHEI